MIQRAIEIAVSAHRGQVDKAGMPYILHPLRVMFKMQTEMEMIAAVLHDVVEDTATTLDDLKNEGFSIEILEAVDCLTHPKEEPYAQYITRIEPNAVARKVKIADLEDNLDLKRLPDPGPKDFERMKRYRKYLKVLNNEQ